jgi:hypothetical protein
VRPVTTALRLAQTGGGFGKSLENNKLFSKTYGAAPIKDVIDTEGAIAAFFSNQLSVSAMRSEDVELAQTQKQR